MGKIFHYYILCTRRLNLSLIFIVFLSGYEECLLAKLREPREENTSADELSQLASKREPVTLRIYIEVLRQPSVSPERLKTRSTPDRKSVV